MSTPRLRGAPPLWIARLEQPEAVNASLVEGFERHRDDADTRHTHFHAGRYENIVVDLGKLPAAGAVLALARACAGQVLGRAGEALRLGAWFNAMQPGDVTLSHSHDIHEELLSAVYYVQVPAASGELVLLDPPVRTVITPEAGLLALFPPDVAHEVTRHRGHGLRLALAMNFGPP